MEEKFKETSFKNRLNDLKSYVLKKIEYLSENENTGTGKAKLAALRRGLGKQPGELPEVWGLLLDGMPESLQENKFVISAAERAIYHALTLFAMSMQGHRGENYSVHSADVSLGKAAGLFTNGDEDRRERIMRRMSRVITASDEEELLNHLRSLIQVLNGDENTRNAGLDYARLAEELYCFTYEPMRESIRMKWARDFYATYAALRVKKQDQEQ